MSRSPPLRVYCSPLGRAVCTRFPFASAAEPLRLATNNNSQTHYAKGRRSRLAALPHIVGLWLQVYFTPLTGVLFTFPSRYSFTIGCQGVFSLIRWSGRIRTEFHVHRATWDTSSRLLRFAYPTVTVYGSTFQKIQLAFRLPYRGPSTPRR
jgi:hypothetical protein